MGRRRGGVRSHTYSRRFSSQEMETVELEIAGSPEDAGLLRDAARGDHRAARIILDEHMPIVYGFVYARVAGNGAIAEDITQETLMEGLRGAGGFRGDSRLSSWLCTIARRRIASHYKKERRRELEISGLHVIGAQESRVDESDVVIRALAALPPTHRQVLTMKYMDDMSVEAIANELGRTRVQVQSLLQRAKVGLKAQMENSNG